MISLSVRSAVEQVDEALDSADELSLLSALQLSCLVLRGLRTDNGPWYLDQLSADRQQKALVHKHAHKYIYTQLLLLPVRPESSLCDLWPQDEGCVDPLDPDELQEGVTIANQEAQRARNSKSYWVCTIKYWHVPPLKTHKPIPAPLEFTTVCCSNQSSCWWCWVIIFSRP